MRRSSIYRLAMLAVLESEFSNNQKLEVLNALFEDERIALFTEKREEMEEE